MGGMSSYIHIQVPPIVPD